MAKNDNKGSYAMIAMVAIVAIVGILMMFMMNSKTATSGITSGEEKYTLIEDGNVIGESMSRGDICGFWFEERSASERPGWFNANCQISNGRVYAN